RQLSADRRAYSEGPNRDFHVAPQPGRLRRGYQRIPGSESQTRWGRPAYSPPTPPGRRRAQRSRAAPPPTRTAAAVDLLSAGDFRGRTESGCPIITKVLL